MTGTPIIKWERRWKQLLAKHSTKFWGQNYKIKPVLIPEVFGDGRQVIGFETFDTRPNYYVVRVDSRWSDSNFICDHTDDILMAIEDHFGKDREEWEHDNGRTYVRHHPFPALHFGTGCCAWWVISAPLFQITLKPKGTM